MIRSKRAGEEERKDGTRRHDAVEALREKVEEDERDAHDLGDPQWRPAPVRLTDLSPEDIEAIRRGQADGDAGREVDGDTFFANLQSHVDS